MYTYIPCLAAAGHTSDVYMSCKNKFSLVAHKSWSWQLFTPLVLGIKKYWGPYNLTILLTSRMANNRYIEKKSNHIDERASHLVYNDYMPKFE